MVVIKNNYYRQALFKITIESPKDDRGKDLFVIEGGEGYILIQPDDIKEYKFSIYGDNNVLMIT